MGFWEPISSLVGQRRECRKASNARTNAKHRGKRKGGEEHKPVRLQNKLFSPQESNKSYEKRV